MGQIRKGNIVEVHFLDHVEDGDKPLEFIVWGRVDRVRKLSLRIIAWAARDASILEGCHAHTEKTFTIVRSAITKIKNLRSV